MRFSHFFVDRPIFAAVISILIILIGAHRLLRACRSPSIRRSRRRRSQVTRELSRRLGRGRRRDRRDAARAGDQRRRGHALHGLARRPATASCRSPSPSRSAPTSTRRRCWCRTGSRSPSRGCPRRCAGSASRSRKNSPDLLMVIHLNSPDGSRDQLYISNYATLQIRDVLARLDGVGDVQVFGARDYSMRIWLDPEQGGGAQPHRGRRGQRRSRGQNVQVASGVLNQPPVPDPGAFQLNVETLGPARRTPRQFENIVVKTDPDGRVTRVARHRPGRARRPGLHCATAISTSAPARAAAASSSGRARTRSRPPTELLATMEELAKSFPPGLDYDIIYNPTEFIAAVGRRGDRRRSSRRWSWSSSS